MTKYRIIENNFKFYVQERIFFCWFYQTDRFGNTEYFDTLESARKEIEKIKANKNSNKSVVVYEE